MTAGRPLTPKATWCDGLPPKEYWAIDPSRVIETPVDNRGLIVVDELIEAVKAYICPEYRWDGPNDTHHLYFLASLYRQLEEQSSGTIPARQFRELAVNKIYIPRRFHNVIHKVTKEAAVPEPEVMSDYLEAWTIARNLFAAVRKAVQDKRRLRLNTDAALPSEEDKVDAEIMAEVASRYFNEINQRAGALSLRTREFLPIDFEEDTRDSISRLGGVLLRGWQLRTRDALLVDDNHDAGNCLRCSTNRSIITPVIN
jgi:hypothetical protein